MFFSRAVRTFRQYFPVLMAMPLPFLVAMYILDKEM
jgi:hypothetical protein